MTSAKLIKVFVTFVLVIVLAEVMNQAYAYVRHGQGVVALLNDETKYVTDAESGLKLLNPAYSRDGFVVNSYGLRSPEIAGSSSARSLKVMFLGASTVMGELAAKNEETFAYLTARKLARDLSAEVTPINAGIAGYRVNDQRRMLRRLADVLHTDILVIYPGFNDVSDYCGVRQVRERRGLPYLSLPDWWMSFNTVRRRSDGLRPAVSTSTREAGKEIEYDRFQQSVSSLVDEALDASKHVILVTGARAFSGNQDEATQWRLSASVRGYVSCMSMSELNRVYDAHNDILRKVSAQRSLPLFDLARVVPAGADFFGDATHFNRRGEAFVSDKLANFIRTHIDLQGDR